MGMEHGIHFCAENAPLWCLSHRPVFEWFLFWVRVFLVQLIVGGFAGLRAERVVLYIKKLLRARMYDTITTKVQSVA
jgi:hypothetical protein